MGFTSNEDAITRQYFDSMLLESRLLYISARSKNKRIHMCKKNRADQNAVDFRNPFALICPAFLRYFLHSV